MGEYAEMAIEREMDLECLFKAEKDFSVWKCRDGRFMKLTDMTDRHLANTVEMLRRKSARARVFNGYIVAMEVELVRRATQTPIKVPISEVRRCAGVGDDEEGLRPQDGIINQ